MSLFCKIAVYIHVCPDNVCSDWQSLVTWYDQNRVCVGLECFKCGRSSKSWNMDSFHMFNLEAQKIQSAQFVNNKLINSWVMTKKMFNRSQWLWPLTRHHQNLLNSFLSADKHLCRIWRNSLIAFLWNIAFTSMGLMWHHSDLAPPKAYQYIPESK